MSLLCLNYRGLGTTQAVSDLRSLLRRLAPTVVSRRQKKTKTEMEDSLCELGTYRGIFVDARGQSSGLGLLWTDTAAVNFLTCSMHHIDVIIKWEGEDVT